MNGRRLVTPDHGDQDHSHAGAHLGDRPGGGPVYLSICLVMARKNCPPCFEAARVGACRPPWWTLGDDLFAQLDGQASAAGSP